MTNGYDFYFKDGKSVLTFPITPGELTLTVGSTNETVTLIDEGEINILKSPSLTEIKFDARFPMRKYPYSRKVDSFKSYYDKFKELKEKKKSFRFIVARSTPKGKKTWDTNLLVSLEEFEISENADEGDDVIVKFKLKQYREYGVRVLKVPKKSTKKETTSTSKKTRPTEKKKDDSQTYVVKRGDCLWNIAKKFYGSGSKWKVIYNANKTAIEKDAKKHGRKSSSNGHWIYPGLKLIIPGVTSSAVTNSSKSSGGSSSNKKTTKKYTVTVRITNASANKGKIRISYTLNGKSMSQSKLTTVSVKVDANTKFQVTFIPSSGYKANKGLTKAGWAIGANSITIPSVKSNSTISVSWGK